MFAIIALLGAGVMLALPRLPSTGATDVAIELRVLARIDVLLALALTTVGFGGMFTVFAYIVPRLREATGALAALVTAMLALFGMGATIGNMLGGKLADLSMTRTLVSMLGLMLSVLAAFAGLMRWPVGTKVLILPLVIASFDAVPPLQMRVMGAAAEAPMLASAMNIGAFNLKSATGRGFRRHGAERGRRLSRHCARRGEHGGGDADYLGRRRQVGGGSTRYRLAARREPEMAELPPILVVWNVKAGVEI